jgi:hypothetical protein
MTGGIIHDGPHYRVVHRPVSADPLTVVYFECWLPAPDRLAPPTAEEFFTRRGINFIGVKPARNDWFQDDEILAALAAVRAAVPAAARLVGYGGSMGGFAAINFAEDLGLCSLLAVCPQVSIQPAKAPFETRWRQEAAAIAFRHDKIDRIRPLRRGFVMFDPLTEDRAHFAAIAARHDLAALPIRFAGHEQLRFLTQAGIAAEVILGLLRGTLSAGDVARLVRRTRRQSNVVWLGVAKALLRRSAPAAALAAMLRACRTPLHDRLDAAITHGAILAQLGRLAEARVLLAPLLADPHLAPAARWHLQHWEAAPPPPRPAPLRTGAPARPLAEPVA